MSRRDAIERSGYSVVDAQERSAVAGVPNRIDLVQAAAARWPMEFAACGVEGPQRHAFVKKLAAFMEQQTAGTDQAGRWGNNGKRGNASDLSDDSIAYRGAGVAIDVVNGGPMEIIDIAANAGLPNIAAAWQPALAGPGDRGAYVAPDMAELGDGGGGVPSAGRAVLGVSHFGALGLYRHDRVRFNEFLSFFRDDLQPDYARIFWYLGDPWWGLVGTGSRSDAERRELLVISIETLLAINVKPQLTVFGTWVEDNGRRRDLVEQFRETARPYASRLFMVDCYNEPGAIGVPEYGYVREVGRQLAGERYPLLSLASPDSLHIGVQGREATDAEVAADVSKLMDEMPAAVNCITPHWGRDPWRPHRPLGRSAQGKTIVNDEPRGVKSSVSAISDPADFGRDFTASVRAGEPYTLHGEPGIWHGYCDARNNPSWNSNNGIVRWQDVPRIREILSALHAVRGGTTVPGPTLFSSELRAGQSLLPGDLLISPEGHARLHYQSDGNLAVYLDGTSVWASGTSGETTGSLQMQPDGNLVLYDAQSPLRATRTSGYPGAMVQLQDDGNFVVYHEGRALWASATSEFFS